MKGNHMLDQIKIPESDLEAQLSTEFANPEFDLSNMRAIYRDHMERAERVLAQAKIDEANELESGEASFHQKRERLTASREKLINFLDECDKRETQLTKDWQSKASEIKAHYSVKKDQCREAVAMAEAALGIGAKEVK